MRGLRCYNGSARQLRTDIPCADNR